MPVMTLEAIAFPEAVLRSGRRHDGRTDVRAKQGEPRTRNFGERMGEEAKRSEEMEREGDVVRTAGAFSGGY